MILPKHKEKELVNSMEQAIGLINAGTHPTDAIEKVARERQYMPEFIDRMAQGINRSLTVSFFRDNPHEKTATFPLADAVEVTRRIYADDPAQKTAALQLPTKDFSDLGFTEDMLDKTAAAADPEMRPRRLREIKTQLYKQAQFFDKAVETARQKVANAKAKLQSAVESSVSEVRKLSKTALNKVAQTVVNGYPESGDDICGILNAFSGIEMPKLQKTSNHCIFPAESVYGSIGEIDYWARRVVDAEGMVLRVKEAAEKNKVMFNSFLGNAAADLLGAGGSDASKDLSSESAIMEMADPAILNKVRENEARTAMMKLVLYDKDLQHYPFQNLLKAYNSSVNSNPESYQYPMLLKNLMLQQLEGGEVKDLQTLKTESEVLKNLVGARKEQQALVRS